MAGTDILTRLDLRLLPRALRRRRSDPLVRIVGEIPLRQSLQKVDDGGTPKAKTLTYKPHEDQAETIVAAIDKAKKEAATEHDKLEHYDLTNSPLNGVWYFEKDGAKFAVAVRENQSTLPVGSRYEWAPAAFLSARRN